MSTFRYAAKGPGGKTVEGTISAADRNEAVAELRRQDLVVMRMDETSAPKAKSGPKIKKQITVGKARPSVKRTELALFTRQLATMVNAGLSLLESLETLGAQAETPGMKATCERLVSEVRGGADLSAAMESCPKAFDPLYISMVRAAEVSGQMDIILDPCVQVLSRTSERSTPGR